MKCFNALLRASSFSTLIPVFLYFWLKMFQCPTSGFFLFYKAKFASEAEKMRFNALLRASSFSTEFKIKKKDKYVLFQCPTSGFFLFYMDNKLHLESTDGLFQCPTSGFFLFYDNHDKKWQAENDVSMPYFGLLSFLQVTSNTVTARVALFQCPTSGFFLFYAMSLHPLILLAFQPPFCK